MKRILKFRDLEKNHITLEVEIREENKERKTIDLKNITKFKVLSICGDLKEFTRGRPRYSCGGQIYDEIITKAGPKYRLIKIWKRWHLNDMQSGTRKQNKCLDDWKERPKGWSYEEDCEYLKKHRLHSDKGYKYGSAWLVEILPEEVMAEIDSLCNKLS
jgi:hypothetical protein